MKKPVILTVDDDVDVLRAVERDLRRQYGDRFRVMRADSGATASSDGTAHPLGHIARGLHAGAMEGFSCFGGIPPCG